MAAARPPPPPSPPLILGRFRGRGRLRAARRAPRCRGRPRRVWAGRLRSPQRPSPAAPARLAVLPRLSPHPGPPPRQPPDPPRSGFPRDSGQAPPRLSRGDLSRQRRYKERHCRNFQKAIAGPARAARAACSADGFEVLGNFVRA
nr:sterile alpha motif domain-containing protein 1-like [Anser cygnoides]